MSTSIINYNKNQMKIKKLSSRFFIFSLLALLIIISISIIVFNFHHNVIEQQNTIRKINKILLNQATIINEISVYGRLFDENISDEEMNSIRIELRQKVTVLKQSTSKLVTLILKSESASIEDLEQYLVSKKIKSKINKYTDHVKTLLNNNSSSAEIKDSVKYISKNSADGDTEYINELLFIVESDYKDGMKKLERMGIAIIFLCLLEIFIVWFFLFKPLNSTVLSQNKQLLDSALKVESASRSRTDFLANISHEIRTPMTAILGYAEVLQDQGMMKPEKVEEAVSIINQNASHLLSLLDEVLDVSKMESGKFDLIIEKINLNNLINEIQSLLLVKAKEKNLELRIKNDGEVPKFIETDPKRLKQVLFNVIGNAIKFTDSGSVELVVTFESLKKLVFNIVDTGCGIPKEKRETIFAPFEQAYTAANRQYAGTGLGLVLSRGLARKMGGDVKVLKSKIGVGTTFQVSIDPGEISSHTLTDKLKTTFNDKKSSAKLSKNLQGKRILIIDDAKENARLFSIYLKAAKAQVEVLNDGFSALELTKNKTFDLILLDLQMPGMDGYQVFQELKKRNYLGPICALTAHAMHEESEKTKSLGFHGHITKPIGSKELVHKINAILS